MIKATVRWLLTMAVALSSAVGVLNMLALIAFK